MGGDPETTVPWPVITRHWAGTPSLRMREATVGIDHIVFGIDFFMAHTTFMDRIIAFLESPSLTPIEQEKVYSKNAERLLGL